MYNTLLYFAIGVVIAAIAHVNISAVPHHDNSTGYKARYAVMITAIAAIWPGALAFYLLYNFSARGRNMIQNWVTDGDISTEAR